MIDTGDKRIDSTGSSGISGRMGPTGPIGPSGPTGPTGFGGATGRADIIDVSGSSGPYQPTPEEAKKGEEKRIELLEELVKEQKDQQDKLLAELETRRKKELKDLEDKLTKANASSAEVQNQERLLNEKLTKEIEEIKKDLKASHEKQVNYIRTLNVIYIRRISVARVVNNNLATSIVNKKLTNDEIKKLLKDTSSLKKNTVVNVTVTTPAPQSWRDWFMNIFNSFFGIEGFVNQNGDVAGASSRFMMLVTFIVMVLFTFMFLWAYSAARLSYTYNKFIGNSHSESLMWSILCFIFPQYYWSAYPFVLNPVCDMKKNKGAGNSNMFGGRSVSRSMKKMMKNVRTTR
jgi:hypothetical protein